MGGNGAGGEVELGADLLVGQSQGGEAGDLPLLRRQRPAVADAGYRGAAGAQFPGSEVLPVSVPVPYTKADGTTGTEFHLGKDGQAAFAADLSKADFRILQATQRPFDADSFTYPTTAAAWRTIPVWGLVAGRDKAIPPACERWMYARPNAREVVEVPTSSHVVMLSHPGVVADLIHDAARAVG
ncbi:alpha/beta fold hydrolase [Kitasatospora purpeofusca]|uniref:alpha/beta fold hydrolase n=1 Tax=Kitasatospora purpeofusca TaxID=67352 RepID=UPI0036D3809B